MSPTKEKTAKRPKPPSSSPASRQLNDNIAALNYDGNDDNCSAGSDDIMLNCNLDVERYGGADGNSSSDGESSSSDRGGGFLMGRVYREDAPKDMGDGRVQRMCLRFLRYEAICEFVKEGVDFLIVSSDEDELLEVKCRDSASDNKDVRRIENEGIRVQIIDEEEGEEGGEIVKLPLGNILAFHSCCESGWDMRRWGHVDDDDFVECDTCPLKLCLHAVGKEEVGCFCAEAKQAGFFRLSSRGEGTTEFAFQCYDCMKSHSLQKASPVNGVSITKINLGQYMEGVRLQSRRLDNVGPMNVSLDESIDDDSMDLDADKDDNVGQDDAKSSTLNGRSKQKSSVQQRYYEEAAANGPPEDEIQSDDSQGGDDEVSVYRTEPNTDDLVDGFCKKFNVGSKKFEKGEKKECVLSAVTCILKKSNTVGDRCLEGFVDSAYWETGNKCLVAIAHYLRPKNKKTNETKKAASKKGRKKKNDVDEVVGYTQFASSLTIASIAKPVVQLARMFHTQHCTKSECTLCDSSLPEQRKDTPLKSTTPQCILKLVKMIEALYEKKRSDLAAEQAKLERKKQNDRSLAKGTNVPNFCYLADMVSDYI